MSDPGVENTSAYCPVHSFCFFVCVFYVLCFCEAARCPALNQRGLFVLRSHKDTPRRQQEKQKNQQQRCPGPGASSVLPESEVTRNIVGGGRAEKTEEGSFPFDPKGPHVGHFPSGLPFRVRIALRTLQIFAAIFIIRSNQPEIKQSTAKRCSSAGTCKHFVASIKHRMMRNDSFWVENSVPRIIELLPNNVAHYFQEVYLQVF